MTLNANGAPRQKEMEITEKWLGEIGGWAAMKAARGLMDAGLVAVQSADASLVRGTAGAGKIRFACGLRIRARTDVDNLCTCPAGRRGQMCEHSIAVALASISPAPRRADTPARSSSTEARSTTTASPRSAALISGSSPGAAPPPSGKSNLNVEERPKRLRVPGRYSAYLPANLGGRPPREPVAVYIKYEAGGEPEESALAAWLADQGIKTQSVPLSLRGPDWQSLLNALMGHPRVIFGRPGADHQPATVADQRVPLPVVIESASDKDILIHCENDTETPISASGAWWCCRETATIFSVGHAGAAAQSVLTDLAAAAQVRRPLAWLVGARQDLAEVFQVTLRGPALEHFHVAPVPCQIELFVDGSLQAVEVGATASHEGRKWPLGRDTPDLFPIQDQQTTSVFYLRDAFKENQILSRLQALGFKPEGPRWRLSEPASVLAFYATHLPRLQREVAVVLGDRWRAATRGVARIVPQVRSREAAESGASAGGGGWLAMEFGYEAPDGFRLPRAEVLRLVRSGQKSVQEKGGRRFVLDLAAAEEFEEVLQDVPLELTTDGARISALHAPYFLPEEESGLPNLPEESQVRGQLGDLGSRLRPYQLLGVRWMQALASSGRGGILADEMGLGKTVQSIAAVCLTNSDKTAGGPVLVVCPKSLVGNWRAEFTRFAPHLKVSAIQGSDRQDLLKNLHAQDVIITTYQLIIRDIEHYFPVNWRLILIDEASYIRNPDTEAAKALRRLRADARLALTGTPVENTTRDLWSIYQFVLPGYLGSREVFKERFEQPIQSGLDTPAGQAASERLKKLIRPYFLRRTKREVLRDLPEKIEQVLWCDPSPAQAEVYRRLLEEGRDEIKAAQKRGGQKGARMTMFTVLLRLRQACCDLRLTGLGEEALKGLDQDDLSSKWPVLLERVEEIIANGGKALIFSQFVQYLRLARAEFDARGQSYCYIDGSSQDRDAQVTAFQTTPERRLFLISLKAGGYGLNLTAADHVILLDPWWNPAVEAQAIDRAHRIGQQRVVTAYRLALRGTVEERILALQARKRGLIEASFDEQSPLMTALGADDLEDLLSE